MCGELVCTVYRGMTTYELGKSDKDEEEEPEMECSKEKLMLPKGMAEAAASLKSLVKI